MAPFLTRQSSSYYLFEAYGHALPVIVPLPLLKVHTLVPQFACVAVNKNVLVPTAENTFTPVVGLKPGVVELVHADDDPLYVEFAAKYASSATAAFLKSDLTCASWPRFLYAANCGIAIAAKIPMIATTTNNSISVKPDSFCNLNLFIFGSSSFLRFVVLLNSFGDMGIGYEF